MEREAKLRKPPTAAAGGSSQRAGVDLLRHAQAALKYHRPLPTGAFSSLDPRVRRLVAEKLQSQSVVDCAAAHEREKGNVGDKAVIGFDQTAESEQIDFSLTTPNTMGTVTESVVSQNVGVNLRNRIASETCSRSEFDTKSVLSYQLSSISGNKRSTLYSADNGRTRSSSMLDNESCCIQGDQLDSANVKKLDLCVQQNFQSSAACNVGSLPDNIHEFMPNPVGQTSLSGLSFTTTTSLHSVPAPLLNSTTHSTRSDVGVETIDEFKLQLQPVTQGDSFMQYGPPYSGSVGVSQPTAVSTQMSGSAPQISVGSEGQSLLNRQDNEIKNHDGLKAVHFSDEPIKGERFHSAKPCETIQASSLAQKIIPSKNAKDLSHVIKSDNDTSCKSSSGSQKKSYNSDFFVKVNGKLYQKLGKIGSGGSSEVYKVISSNCTIYALKMIKLKGRDYSTAYGFCQEIKYLNKLKGNNNIIQLIDYEAIIFVLRDGIVYRVSSCLSSSSQVQVTNRTLLEHLSNDSMTSRNGNIKDEGHIYMILEYGEIDLAHMLSQKWKEMNNSSQTIDENWLRFYWQQILLAVNTIHEERIVHSDLKPANFLLVKGSLKLIDFGIAKAIMSDTTNIQRDAQMGTLNYMSPEAYMWNEEDAGGSTIKCGRPSDIWSLGCILYQMVYGRTPFSEYKNLWAKFKAITDRNHKIKYGPVSNPWLLDLMKKCLAWDRDQRWRIPQLLQHPFLVPPAPPQLSPSRCEHCMLLVQMAEAYGDDTQVSSLCNQLHDIIATVDDGTCMTSLY